MRLRMARTRMAWMGILGIAALGVVGCSGSQRSEDAQTDQAITVSLGGNVYQSGIPTAKLQFSAAPDSWGRQRSDNWCWAADLQTILDYHGLSVMQEQVVQRAFGALVDQPLAPSQIAASVNGWTLPSASGPATVVAAEVPFDVAAILKEMHAERPSIVGLKNPGGGGHAYVLTSITYAANENVLVPLSVTLRDPWPENPNFKTMSFAELQAAFIGLVFIDVVHAQ